jgi:hypothetical protein
MDSHVHELETFAIGVNVQLQINKLMDMDQLPKKKLNKPIWISKSIVLDSRGFEYVCVWSKLGLLMSALSQHINRITFDTNVLLHHVGLGSTYAMYNNFCIKGKIVTIRNITHENYVK